MRSVEYTTLISAAELATRLPDPTWVIVDCHHNLADVDAGERAYRSGHIAGAQFMHMDRDLSGARTGVNGRHPLPQIADIVATLGRAGIDDSKQVIAYDQNNGMWASRLWWLLQWLGHPAAGGADGGAGRVGGGGHSLTAEEPRVRPATFIARQPTPIASAGEIMEHLGDGAR